MGGWISEKKSMETVNELKLLMDELIWLSEWTIELITNKVILPNCTSQIMWKIRKKSKQQVLLLLLLMMMMM